jgi:hypothetical protein
MIAFDLSVSAVTAQALALVAGKQLKREKSIFFNKTLFLSFLWQALIYTPSGIAMYFGFTAWNSGYFFNPYPGPVNQPGDLAIIVCWIDGALINLSFLAAFILAHKWIKQNKEKNVIIFSSILTVLLLLFWILDYQRNFTATSYSVFQQLPREGIKFAWGGTSFWGSRVFWYIVLMFFVDYTPLGFLIYWFRKGNKKIA